MSVPAEALPHPPLVPTVGVLGSAAAFAADPLGFTARPVIESGGIVRVRLGLRHWIAVCDDALMRDVLVGRHETFVRSFHYRRGMALNGGGLIQVDGPQWLARRRQMLPLFRPERMRNVATAAATASAALVERWTELARAGGTVDASREADRLTLAVISETLLSEPIGDEDAERIAGTLHGALFALRTRNTGALPLPLALPTPANNAIRRSRQVLDAYVTPHIRARRDGGADRHNDLLSAIMALSDGAGAPLPDEAVRDEGKTLFSAGFETTANALGWTLDLLARHPDRQESLHAALADAPDELARADLGDLVPLLGATVDEALRLYPPVYLVGREAAADTELGGYRVPKGTTIVMSVYGLHRHPRHWDDPDTFEPMRFIDRRAPKSRAYMPFVVGKHRCIGETFALVELAVAVASVVRSFRLRPVEAAPNVPMPRVTLAPSRPITLHLEPR